MPTVSQLDVVVNAETGGAVAGLGRIAQMLGSSSPLLLGVGAVVAGVAGLGAISIKMAGDFQQGMTSLVTGAGESRSNIQLVSDGILQMARDTGTTTDQLTSGMYMIESAGYHGAAGLDVLKAAAQGAKVGNADLGTVADATTTIMKDYASSHISASGAVNALIATVANGKTRMQDLAGAMAQILPTASAAGIGLNDVMAAMATMTGEGVPAANAATYLRQTILALDAPGGKAVSALKAVGLSSADVASEMQKSLPDALRMITDAVGKHFPVGSAAYVAALKDIAGGSKQMQGILDLTGSHMKDFQGNLGGIGGAVKQAGNSIAGWGDVQKDFNFKMSQLKEVVDTAMIALGTKLLPIVTTVASAFTDGLNWAVSHATTLIQIAGPIILGVAAGIAASLVPALLAAAAAALPLIGAAIAAAAPFIAIGAAVAALAFAVQYAYTHFAPFREAVQSAGAVLKAALGDAIKFAVPIIHQVVTAVETFAAQLSTRLGPAAQNVFGFIQQALGVLQVIWNAVWPGMQLVLHGVWNVIKGDVEIAWSIVSGIIKIGLDILGGNWKQAWNDLLNMLRGVWQGIQTALGGELQIIGGLLRGALGLIGTVWRAAWAGITAPFKAAWDAVVGIVSGAITTLVGWFNTAYQHSTVFAAIVDAIKLDFTVAKVVVETIWRAITGVFQGAVSLISGIVKLWWQGVVLDFHIAQTLLGDAISLIINGIITPLKNLLTPIVEIGKDLITGLINGIKNMAGAAGDAIKGIGQGLLGGLKGALGIHSPSTVFAEVGQNLSLGLIQGFQGVDVTGALKDHLAGLASVATASVGLNVNGSGLAGVGGAAGGGIVPQLGASAAASISAAQQQAALATLLANQQPAVLQLDGRTIARLLLPYHVAEVRVRTGSRTA